MFRSSGCNNTIIWLQFGSGMLRLCLTAGSMIARRPMSALLWARKHQNWSGSLVYRQSNRWFCGQSSPQNDESPTVREMTRCGDEAMAITWVGTGLLTRPMSGSVWARRRQNWSGSLVFRQSNRWLCGQSSPQSDEDSVTKLKQIKTRKAWSARNRELVEQGAYKPSNKLVAALLKMFPTMGGLFINYGMVYLGFHYTTYVASFALAFVALQQGLVHDVEPEALFNAVDSVYSYIYSCLPIDQAPPESAAITATTVDRNSSSVGFRVTLEQWLDLENKSQTWKRAFLAFCFTELTNPIRTPFVVMFTPTVARLMGRKPRVL